MGELSLPYLEYVVNSKDEVTFFLLMTYDMEIIEFNWGLAIHEKLLKRPDFCIEREDGGSMLLTLIELDYLPIF